MFVGITVYYTSNDIQDSFKSFVFDFQSDQNDLYEIRFNMLEVTEHIFANIVSSNIVSSNIVSSNIVSSNIVISNSNFEKMYFHANSFSNRSQNSNDLKQIQLSEQITQNVNQMEQTSSEIISILERLSELNIKLESSEKTFMQISEDDTKFSKIYLHNGLILNLIEAITRIHLIDTDQEFSEYSHIKEKISSIFWSVDEKKIIDEITNITDEILSNKITLSQKLSEFKIIDNKFKNLLINSNEIIKVELQIAEDKLQDSINQSILILFLVVIITVGFSVMICTFFAQRFLKPLEKLTDATSKVSKGNFDVTFDKFGDDEFGKLSKSFELMLDSIKTSQEKVEEQDELLQIKNLKLEAEILEKQKKLLKAERFSAIGELSARIAHDIRNPLGIIRTSMENIKVKPNDPEFVKKSMVRCDNAIRRITHQIEEVMDFLRDSPLNLKNVGLSDLLKSIISELEVPDGIKIILPTNDAIVLGDKVKLQSLFYNLIINAIQKLEDNGIITIKIFNEYDSMVKITIEDDGESISDDIILQIFEPLFTTKLKGTGLGLAGTKKIVEQHRGRISVTNDPVTFTVFLPTLK